MDTAGSVDVLRKNEIDANKVMVVTLIAVAFTAMIKWLLTDTYAITNLDWERGHYVYGAIILEMLIGVFIGVRVNYRPKWLKYLLMMMLILALAVIDTMFTYNVTILAVIPLVLSSRYFSCRYTVTISILTMIVFMISSILGVYLGITDLNDIELPIGTVIQMEDTTWLSDLFEEGKVSFDRTLVLENTIRYTFVLDFLQLLIVATACIAISYQGRRMIFEQKDMTEREARVKADLELAAKIQSTMLPDESSMPDRPEFALAASMTPAKEVGGDFYDCFMIDGDHLGMVIADVSGKGVPAAMFMMSSKAVLSSFVMPGKSPAEILNSANDVIFAGNRESMFVTVWLGILEISTGKLTAVNAGHEDPAIMDPDGGFILYKDLHGVVLGSVKGVEYWQYELDLKPGSKIFLYTDGVVEAINREEKMYGTDRLIEVLNEDKNSSPSELLGRVRRSVDSFCGGVDQFDDLTMLCLEYKGSED